MQEEAAATKQAESDNSTVGLIKNTVMGLPQGAADVGNAVKDFLAPGRGYTDEQIGATLGGSKMVDGKLVQTPSTITTTDKVKGIARFGTEMYKGIGDLGALAVEYTPDVVKDTLKKTMLGRLASYAASTKAGQYVTEKVGQGAEAAYGAIEDFAQPKSAEEAAVMRGADILTLGFGGVTKNIGKSIRVIAELDDAALVAKELKGLGIADELVTKYTPVMTTTRNEKMVSDMVTRAMKETEALKATPAVTREADIAKGQIANELKAPAAVEQTVDALPIAVPKLGLDANRFGFTSFNPERKVARYEADFQSEVQDMYEKLAKVAKTDAQKEILKGEMERYTAGLRSRLLDIAATDSRVANPMVTGRANFNFARRDKAAGSYRNKVEALDDFKAKAESAMLRKFKEQNIEDAGGVKGFTEQQLEKALKVQQQMKDANAVVRSKLSDEEKIAKLNTILGTTPENSAKLLKPGFGGSKGFAGYQLTSINNKIKALQAKIGKVAKNEELAATVGKKVEKIGDIEVIQNYELDRLQVKFQGKPSPEMIAKLKSHGFKWSPSNQTWQRQLTPNAKYSLKNFVLKDEIAAELAKPKAETKAIEQSGKIVATDNGKLYHGTSADIVGNKLSFGVGNLKKGGQSGGHFLTDSEDFAKVFGNKIYEADAAIKNNVLDLSDQKTIDLFRERISTEYKTLDGEIVKYTKEDFDTMFPNGKADFASISHAPEIVEEVTKQNGKIGVAFEEYAGGKTAKTYQVFLDNIDVKPLRTTVAKEEIANVEKIEQESKIAPLEDMQVETPEGVVQIGEAGVRQAETPKAFEITKVTDGKPSEVDKLIADGKIRVKYQDGRDVYQVKKGSEWATVRDESSAIKKVTEPKKFAPPKPKQEIVLPQELENKIAEMEQWIEVQRDAVKNMLGQQLKRYADKRDMQLPEMTGTPTIGNKAGRRDSAGKVIQVKNSRWGREGDSIWQEIAGAGNDAKSAPDARDAQRYLDETIEAEKDLRENEAHLKDLYRQAREYKKGERAVMKDDEAVSKLTAKTEKEINVGREAVEKKIAEDKKPVATPIEDTATRAEVRSLERLAREAQNSIDPQFLPKTNSLHTIVERYATDVKDKVHTLDYLRTPERVLEKIGLGDEARYLRDQYQGYLAELPDNIKKIADWEKRASSPDANEQIFKWLDGEVVELKPQDQKIADEIQVWLKEWAARLKLPEDNRVTDYITHIFDRELIKKEFDEDLARIIADRLPGAVYDPFLQKRLGAKGYKQDTWLALEAYVKRGTRKVYVDPALERIQAKAGTTVETSQLEKSQFNYVKSYIDSVNMRPTAFEEGIDNLLKLGIGYKFGQRPLNVISRTLRQMSYRAMLGLNPASALRNLSQGVNTYATLGEKYTAIGYAKLFNRGSFEEAERAGIFNHSFIDERTLSARKKFEQGADKVLFFLFEGAEKINRTAAFQGAKAKAIGMGKTEEEAIKYAQEIVRKTQFAFGAIDNPVLLNNDLVKTMTQFQSFNIKQVEFLSGLAKDKDYMALLRYSLAGLAFVYTAGKAIGMEPADIIPFNSLFDPDRSPLASTPPSIKVPKEVIGAVMDAPDKFGNKRTVQEKLSDIGKATLTSYVPAGSQIKKTYEGITAINAGGSFDAGNNFQFEVGTSPLAKTQAVLFGKYANPNAKKFFAAKEEASVDKSKIAAVYEENQRLIQQGRTEDALAILKNMSAEDQAAYKKYKTGLKREKTLIERKNMLPTFQKLRAMKEAGKADEALAEYSALSDEDKASYQAIKKQVERDQKATSGVKPLFDDGEVQTQRSLINTVSAYARAIGTDPITAIKMILTGKGQEMRYTAGGAIIIDRIPVDESEAIKKKQNGDSEALKLDHTVPLQLGGDNSESNLNLVPTETWRSFTPVENKLGDAVRGGRMEAKKAQELIKKFKAGEMSAEDVLKQIP